MTIHDLINKEIISAASYAILKENFLQKEYLGRIDDQQINHENVLFDLASLTKLFVSTRILQMMESHQLKLEDAIHQHLPEFMIRKITIEDCLTHQSGLSSSPSGRYTMTKEKMIATLLAGNDFTPEKYHTLEYSCSNFLVLGLVIEALDQCTLQESFSQHIFKTAGMTNTTFNPDKPDLCAPSEVNPHRGIIRGTVHDQTALKMGGISGNAGLFSTLDDLIKFMQAYLNYALLKKSTIDLLFKTNIKGRSLGWNCVDSQRRVLYHTGFTGTFIVFDHERSSVLIVLSNRTFPNRENPIFLENREKIIQNFIK